MSYVLVRGVFERGPKGHQNRGCRFILLCLADHANEDGTSCFPRVSTIAEQCQFTERYVKAGLKKLEEDGWIRSVQNPQEKDGRRNGYVIAADR
jgi:DNA-binding MarR family transcriptional regulator